MKGHAQALSADQILSIPSTHVEQARKVRAVKRHKVCRHCSKRLPFLRSFFKNIFCNRTHEHAYVKNMEELALERLRVSAVRIKFAAQQTMAAAVIAEPPTAH